MGEFIIGFVCGMAVMLAGLSVIYVPMITRLRYEISKLKIELIHK